MKAEMNPRKRSYPLSQKIINALMAVLPRMKRTIILLTLALPFWSWAWDNPNRTAAPLMIIAPDQPSVIRLENHRVVHIDGDIFLYDTGFKTIKIKSNSTKCRIFLEEVKSGRTSAHVTVTIIPIRPSPFNTEFKAH